IIHPILNISNNLIKFQWTNYFCAAEMKKLNLPDYQFKLKEENKKTKIFDALRKKFLVLTPEEWVRQNTVQFLIEERNFPKGLIVLEKSLKLNGLVKRADILVYSKSGNPLFMVECKAPE